MSSAGFYFLVFLLALAAYLAAKADRERMPLGGGSPEPPGPFANVFFYFAKWTMILSFLGFLLPALIEAWPPRWLEHRQHRRQANERIIAAGGWDRLHQDTALLLATNQGPRWSISYPHLRTNFVTPPAIAALKPLMMELNPAQTSNTATYRVFGTKSTGGRRQATYWLVVAENAALDVPAAIFSSYRPARTIRQLTNGVFEVY